MPWLIYAVWMVVAVSALVLALWISFWLLLGLAAVALISVLGMEIRDVLVRQGIMRPGSFSEWARKHGLAAAAPRGRHRPGTDDPQPDGDPRAPLIEGEYERLNDNREDSA